MKTLTALSKAQLKGAKTTTVDWESAHVRESIQRLTRYSNHHTVQAEDGNGTVVSPKSKHIPWMLIAQCPSESHAWLLPGLTLPDGTPVILVKFSQAEGSASSHGQRRPVPHPASDIELGGVRWTSPTNRTQPALKPLTFTVLECHWGVPAVVPDFTQWQVWGTPLYS